MTSNRVSFDVYGETAGGHGFTPQDVARTLLDAPAPGFEIGKAIVRLTLPVAAAEGQT